MAGRKLFLANKMVVCMVFVLASTSLITTLAVDDPQTLELGHGCSNDRYVDETAFKDNLNKAFEYLASNIFSSNNFFATSESKNGNTDYVYALLLCRKYLTLDACQECFRVAEKIVRKYCSNEGFKGGRIHLDGCFLRYEISTFFTEGTDPGNSTYCLPANESKLQEFNQTAQTLLSRLTANVYNRDKFASGDAPIASTTLYGVAQCVPTLSEETCQNCLNERNTILVNSCFPNQEGRGLQPGCFLRYAPSPFYGNSPPPGEKWPILLGSIGGAALLAAICFVYIWRRFSQRFKGYIRGIYRYTKTEVELVAAETFEQLVFEYDVLRDATGNFDNANLGEVYKGILPEGRAIAVKKLSESRSSKAMEEFLTEVKLISSVRHRNLVHLHGCCAQGHERLLVYEFMSNNSLDKHLFGDTRNHLDWNTRFNILVGTAHGLAYLHEDINIRIVHRDIKAANILLDDNFNPKIADFGLAKFFPEGDTHVYTRFAGTRGYMAPEYAVHSLRKKLTCTVTGYWFLRSLVEEDASTKDCQFLFRFSCNGLGRNTRLTDINKNVVNGTCHVNGIMLLFSTLMIGRSPDYR